MMVVIIVRSANDESVVRPANAADRTGGGGDEAEREKDEEARLEGDHFGDAW